MSNGQDGLLTDRHGQPIGEPLLLVAWLVFLGGVIYPAGAICVTVIAAGLGNALGAEPSSSLATAAAWFALLATVAAIALFWMGRRSAKRRERPLRTTTIMLIIAIPITAAGWITVAALSGT